MEPADADVAAPRRSPFPNQRGHRVTRHEHRGGNGLPRGAEPDEFDESHLIRGYD